MRSATQQDSGVPARHGEGHAPAPPWKGAPSRPLSSLERGVWEGFVGTHTRLLRILEQEIEAAERLSLSSYEVLLRLADAPEGRLRMKDIASLLLISPSGLTRVVDDLERRSYVERRKCPTDARGLDAVLTPVGLKAVRRARKVFVARLRKEFLDKLGDEQLAALRETWGIVDLDAPGAAAE